MAEETDGIEEAFGGQLRVLVTAAGQVGERLARAREEALRNAQARSEQEYRELQSRIEAERRAARVEMANVHRSDWWDRATPEQIGRTYQLARAWSQEDPEAMRTEQRVRDELRARYGIDAAGADPEAVRQRIRLELDRAERDHAGSDAERGRSAAEQPRRKASSLRPTRRTSAPTRPEPPRSTSRTPRSGHERPPRPGNARQRRTGRARTAATSTTAQSAVRALPATSKPGASTERWWPPGCAPTSAKPSRRPRP